MPETGPPKWISTLFPAEVLPSRRERLHNGEGIALRGPSLVCPKKSDKAWSGIRALVKSSFGKLA
jgi:hypothetical protein